MTAPTITYGHGYMNDCIDATGWNETVSGMAGGDATLSVDNNDIFKIEAVFDGGAADEYCYYENATDIDISSNTYPYIRLRYKTSEQSAGAMAKMELVFDDASTQTILDGSYNTSWTTINPVAITSGKTIDHIRFYADDDGTDGTFYVYYDFALIYKNTFTFPEVTGGLDVVLQNRYADLSIPQKGSDIQQWMGMRDAEIAITGRIDNDSDWGSPLGQHLLQVMVGAFNDPWQWFTSDILNCKLSPRYFRLSQRSSVPASRDYEFRGKMYSISGSDAYSNLTLEFLNT